MFINAKIPLKFLQLRDLLSKIGNLPSSPSSLSSLSSLLQDLQPLSLSSPLALVLHSFRLTNTGNSYLSKSQAPIIKQKELILFGNACGIVDFDAVMECARVRNFYRTNS
jgi:hypothetical protein